jgi:deoxyribodipyrimidine photo-lyase
MARRYLVGEPMQLPWQAHDLLAWLPQALRGLFCGAVQPPPQRGGRTVALQALAAYDVADYGTRRNSLTGPVSRLSPYLRHGMLSLVEVKEHIQARYQHQPKQCEEFLRQLAWRDFFEKVLAWHGLGLLEDLEEAKHSVERQHALPADIAEAATGLPCMDGMLKELFSTGYLHNHERLWFAAYLCHFRGVRWQTGATLFRQYLLDGDWASNSASWQWVESTFANKPYFMNKDNIARFSDNSWCADCTAKCPFDAEYPALEQKLFRGQPAPLALFPKGKSSTDNALSAMPHESTPWPNTTATDLVWVHDAALSWEDAALKNNPNAAVVVVLDEPSFQDEPWAYHRLHFLVEGVQDLFAHLPNQVKLLLLGDTALSLKEAVNTLRAERVHISEHPNTIVTQVMTDVSQDIEVVQHARPVFAEYTAEPVRFSRYWNKVAKQVLGYAPKTDKRFHQ